jgi:hypothetical protein
MKEAIGFLIAAITSLESARFSQYLAFHSGSKNSDLARFLPAYALADWAKGNIDKSAWNGREPSSKESLQRWAHSMIELNTFFRKYQIDDPIQFLMNKRLITKSTEHFGWDANLNEVATFLGVTIPKDSTK